MIKPELFEEEKKIWYSKFYDLPLEISRPGDEKFLDKRMDPSKAYTIHNYQEFVRVKDEKEEVENGYCIGEDGHGYVTVTEYYPEFTAEMIDWWFAFLSRRPKNAPVGHGNLRYKIWCPPDHWDHGLLDPDEPSSGLFINETLDLGAGTMDRNEIINRRYSYAQAGIPEDMVKAFTEAGYYVITGSGFVHGRPTGCGINIYRPVKEGGCKWSSISFKGYTYHDGKIVEVPGAGVGTDMTMRRELLHNIVERRHLHNFLGELYEKQHLKPLDED